MVQFDWKKSLSYFNCFPKKYKKIITIDCETTGIYLQHDSRPFMLCVVSSDGEGWTWRGHVNPLDRTVSWSNKDGLEIADMLNQPDTLCVLTNKKFDIRCMTYIVPDFDPIEFLSRAHDTLPMHHVFNNKEGHGLKNAALKYADVPDKDEKTLLAAVREAKKLAQDMGLKWAFASKLTCPQQTKAPAGEKDGGKGWAVMDYWLPEAVAAVCWERSEAKQYFDDLIVKHSSVIKMPFAITAANLFELRTKLGWAWHPASVIEEDAHPWYTLCQEYCLYDCYRTLLLFQSFEHTLTQDYSFDPLTGEKRSLFDVYLENSPAFTISYQVEDRGLTYFHDQCVSEIARLTDLRSGYATAVSMALNPFTTFNPASSAQISSVIYHRFKIPVSRRTAPKRKRGQSEDSYSMGNPTTDEDFLVELLKVFTPPSPEDYRPPLWQKGVEDYKDYLSRLHDWHRTISSQGEGIQLFTFIICLLLWKKVNSTITKLKGYVHAGQHNRLHPSLNPIGAKTPRYSSSNPNGQNIAKGKKSKISRDLARLYPELKRNLRTYFGPLPGREWWSIDYTQLQLVIAATLHKSERMLKAIAAGYDFHDAMARIIYKLSPEAVVEDSQRDITKNVNFGYWFGAGEEKVDLTCGVHGMYEQLNNLFPEVPEALDRMGWEVRRNGFVTTLGGYRLYVPEDAEYSGCVYAVQGSEGVLVKRATYCVQHWMETTRSAFSREGHYIGLQDRVPEPANRPASFLQPTALPLSKTGHSGFVADDIGFNLFLHDELDFDATAGRGYAYIPTIVSVMELAAASFGVPAKAVAKFHPNTWGEYVQEEKV